MKNPQFACCCHNGQVVLADLHDPLEQLQPLFIGSDAQAHPLIQHLPYNALSAGQLSKSGQLFVVPAQDTSRGRIPRFNAVPQAHPTAVIWKRRFGVFKSFFRGPFPDFLLRKLSEGFTRCREPSSFAQTIERTLKGLSSTAECRLSQSTQAFHSPPPIFWLGHRARLGISVPIRHRTSTTRLLLYKAQHAKNTMCTYSLRPAVQ
ncbi:hypothetical protein BJV78DRAFT_707207 [Lactifluus subvellereus]|nr:hypothetical protein BJV78DRAFT_707207 [Lactifluus subvellereus]